MRICLALLFGMLFVPVVAAQDWSEGFESGLGTAKPYHADAPTTTLEIATSTPAYGKQFLRAALPGKRRLEGFSVTAGGLKGARLATVTAKVRGRGDIWLCLLSRNGWLYSPRTVRLTGQWQEVSLSKALAAADTNLGIYFLSQGIQSSALFEVDDVRVALSAPPQVFDAEVGPGASRQRSSRRDTQMSTTMLQPPAARHYAVETTSHWPTCLSRAPAGPSPSTCAPGRPPPGRSTVFSLPRAETHRYCAR